MDTNHAPAPPTNETAAAIAEMLTAWRKVDAAAREQWPSATEEDIYQLTARTMRHALKL